MYAGMALVSWFVLFSVRLSIPVVQMLRATKCYAEYVLRGDDVVFIGFGG